jgi:hypothetical protein
MWNRLRHVRPATVLGIGWLVFIAYGWPGLLSRDSFEQLSQGRSWFFTDFHPPAMAALWGIIDRIIPGTVPMLVIQGTAFELGIYLLLKRALAPRKAALWTVVLLLFPPVLAPMVVIWKDCLMAGSLVLGTAAVLDQRRWVRVLGLAAFAAATAFRLNAPAAVLPLVVLLFEWEPGKRALVRYGIAVAAWVALTVAAFGLNAILLDQEMHYFTSSLAPDDIMGTLAKVKEDLPDSELKPILDPTGFRYDRDLHQKIRARYMPAEFTQYLAAPGPWTLPMTGTTPIPAAQHQAIAHAWWTVITSHKAAYIRFRLETFGEVLGVFDHFLGATVVRHKSQHPEWLAELGLSSGQAAWQDKVERWFLGLAKHTPLFRPHVYALLALLLLGFTRGHRDVLALLLSGLLLELSLLPLAQTPDYRYSHWLVTVTCLSLIMLVARRARAQL